MGEVLAAPAPGPEEERGAAPTARRFPGASGRLVAGGLLAAPGAAAVAIGSVAGIPPVTIVGGAAVVAGFVRAASIGIELQAADVYLRNGPFRRRHLPADEIAAIEPARRLGLPHVRFLRRDGSAVVAAASIALPGREDPSLHLALRRWCRERAIPDRLSRVELRHPSTRSSLLATGEEVAVPGHARRTTTRGWGPWVRGWLRFRGGDGDDASFVVSEPEKLDLVTSRATAPMPLSGPGSVDLRPVRFKEEAFWGRDGRIIVWRGERHTVEVALARHETDSAVDRLRRRGAGG